MRIELAPRITMDPMVCFGKPVIEGTRVPVDIVVEAIRGGLPVEVVMQEWVLSREVVEAAMTFGIRRPARARRRSRADVPASWW